MDLKIFDAARILEVDADEIAHWIRELPAVSILIDD